MPCPPSPGMAAGTLGPRAHRRPTCRENGLKRKPRCTEHPEGAGMSPLHGAEGAHPLWAWGLGCQSEQAESPGQSSGPTHRLEAPSGGPRESALCRSQGPVGRTAGSSSQDLGVRPSSHAGDNARPRSRNFQASDGYTRGVKTLSPTWFLQTSKQQPVSDLTAQHTHGRARHRAAGQPRGRGHAQGPTPPPSCTPRQAPPGLRANGAFKEGGGGLQGPRPVASRCGPAVAPRHVPCPLWVQGHPAGPPPPP